MNRTDEAYHRRSSEFRRLQYGQERERWPPRQRSRKILYVLLVAEVVSGFVLRRQGELFQFFALFSMPTLMAPDRALASQFEQIHNWIGWAIVALSAGHAIAALVHHYVLKDQVLGRMLPRSTVIPGAGK